MIVGGSPTPAPSGTDRFLFHVIDAQTANAIFDACMNVNNAQCTAPNLRTNLSGYAWFDLPSTSSVSSYTFGFTHSLYVSTQLTRTYTPGMGTVLFTVFMRRTGT